MTDLRLFNSLTRQLEPFQPVHANEARVYSCGPTVYNYQHIGNMRAYVFADTLGRVLRFKGYDLRHIINITDVGHLTSDADAGDDKMEKAAASAGKTAWDIAAFYTGEFKRDLKWLNVTDPAKWTVATDYVPAMIEYAKSIADKHCYELDSGLYFDVSTVPDYGRLARAATDEGEGRIDEVSGKRHQADFAIWRKTPAGETRQMEWDSPWGRGAPGWHLECSVMSAAELGMPFDIHTGGIDHREIHHPNEIAQNQAHECSGHTGANIWMHNNFLIDRGGKMSKSAGEFLRLQTLVDRGYHPLAYRMMCLQAHYRSELEFSWDGLQAALVRLKRIVMGVEKLSPDTPSKNASTDIFETVDATLAEFSAAVSDDLNTPLALTQLEQIIIQKGGGADYRRSIIMDMDKVLGLNFLTLTRQDLRIRPKSATISEPEIEAVLTQRKEARAAKDFATSDRLRDELAAQGVEVMDGDPLGWDWKLAE
ncbi:MAG: cysteine--tRNA ligase [Novosphingobium sp.]